MFYKKGEIDMKKAVKHFAALALCLCVLANFLPVQAAADTTKLCTICGKTAYYSGSVLRSSSKTGNQVINGVAYDIYKVYYEDTYTCGSCGSPSRFVRMETEYHPVDN